MAPSSASGFSVEAYTDIVTERLPKFKDASNGYGALIAKRNHTGDQASLQVWAAVGESSRLALIQIIW